MAPSSGGGCRRCRHDMYMRRQLAAMHAALAVDDMFPCKAWVCPAHVWPSPVWFRVGQHSRRRLRRLLGEPGGTAILAGTSEQTRRESEVIGVLQGCSPGMPWSAVWLRGCEFGIAPLKDIAGCSNGVRPPAAGGHGAKAAWETTFADHLKTTEDPILRTTEGKNRDTACFGGLRRRHGRPWDDGGWGDGRCGPPAHHRGPEPRHHRDGERWRPARIGRLRRRLEREPLGRHG